MPTAIGGPVPKLESRIEVSAGRIAIPVAGGLEIGADIWWWGVFGREGYNLQGNDNRNTGEPRFWSFKPRRWDAATLAIPRPGRP